MRISAINTASYTNFQGEHSKEKLRNTAGTAMVLLAAAIPANEAKAQFFTPPPPAFHQYYVPTPVMKVPKCFIYGDETNENYEKTMSDVFNEIDREIEQNGQISVNEVVSLEAYNHNSTHTYPMTREEKLRTADLVKNLSEKYNENNSNPKTINYNEYKSIMSDYMNSKNITDFITLMQMFSNRHPHPHNNPYAPITPGTPPRW